MNKARRITWQRLSTLRDEHGKDCVLNACFADHDFKPRREDLRRLRQTADAKMFSLATMQLLIVHTRIREHRVR